MSNAITTYQFKAGLPQEFEILDIADTFEKHKEILTATHRAGFYHVIWFQKGSPTHLVDFKPIKIKPNSLLFLNKDTVQRFDATTKFEGKVILFTDYFFCKTEAYSKYLRNSILFNDLFAVSEIYINQQTELFETLLLQMTQELQCNNAIFQADILHNLLHNFLLLAERERRQQNFTEIKKSVELDIVMLFKNILEKEYKNEKQVKHYAQKLLITEKRLNHATTKVLGKTPKELINERVLLEAQRILAHSTDSVKEIAYELGFEEPTNFIKYFKKFSLLTPTEFREKKQLA